MVDKKKVIKSVSSMGMCSGITAALSILQLTIVARFLTPEDYGVFAIPNIIVGTGSAFLAGVPLALIQRSVVTEQQVAAMQKSLYLIALLLSGVLPAFAFIVSSFSGVWDIFVLTLGLSVTLLITALGLLHQVWIRRELQMEKIALANVMGVAVGVMTAIYFAWQGFGCWALVFAAVSRELVVLMLIRQSSILEIPRQSNLAEVKPLLGFGLSRGTDQVLGQFTSKLDQLAVGAAMGAASLGIYTVASNVARRPSDLLRPVLGSVLFPLYAKLKSSHEVYAACEMSLGILSFVMLAVASLVALFSSEIVYILLGQSWAEVSPVLGAISYSFAFQMMEVPAKQVVNAAGLSNRLLLWNVFTAVVVALILMVVASNYPNLTIVALAMVFAKLVLYLISFYVLLSKAAVRAWGLMLRSLFCGIMPSSVFIAVVKHMNLSIGGKCVAGVTFCVLLLLLNLKLAKQVYSKILS